MGRLALSAFALIAGAATATPTLVEREVEYEIAGRDAAALNRAIAERGPRDDAGMPRTAHTRYDARWRYGFREFGGRCNVTRVELTVEIVVTLPRWIDAERGDPALRQRWTDFRAAVARHETGHVELARDMAQRLEDVLWRGSRPGGCEGFAAELEAAAKRVLAEDRARQDGYDATNGRGTEQGATL